MIIKCQPNLFIPYLFVIFLCNKFIYLSLEKLEKLLTSEEKQTCIVEHILCTKPLAEMESVPVLGLDVAINDANVTMICLLASWEFLCFPLMCVC